MPKPPVQSPNPMLRSQPNEDLTFEWCQGVSDRYCSVKLDKFLAEHGIGRACCITSRTRARPRKRVLHCHIPLHSSDLEPELNALLGSLQVQHITQVIHPSVVLQSLSH